MAARRRFSSIEPHRFRLADRAHIERRGNHLKWRGNVSTGAEIIAQEVSDRDIALLESFSYEKLPP